MQENEQISAIDQYINVDKLLQRIRGNKKLLRKMLRLFLESKEFSALEDALAQNDYPKAAEIAHAIKGITGNLAVTTLYEESSSLMLQLKQGPPAEDTLAKYRSALTNTLSCVQELATKLDAEA